MNLIEITNAYETAEQAAADWSILDDEEVLGIAQRAARKASEEYGLTLEYEDAYQEAQLLLATRPNKARAALNVGPGALFRWLGQRLRDDHLTEVKHRSTAKSWEVNQEQLEALGY